MTNTNTCFSTQSEVQNILHFSQIYGQSMAKVDHNMYIHIIIHKNDKGFVVY